MERQTPSLCIVVPCYNEAQVLPTTMPLFCAKLDGLVEGGAVAGSSRVLFVDDGSTDSTWELISRFSHDEQLVEGIKLSRNCGHQKALLAGLMEAREKFDVTISIDCDGQDDIDAMDAMIAHYQAGCEVVYGVRSDRSSDTAFKRLTAESYYRLLDSMGVEVVFNHADYRLMSSQALRALAEYGESNLFLRGIVPQLGFAHGSVEYERHSRAAGESHYPLRKMLHLAFDGITSFSTGPIRLISKMGIAISVVSFIGLIWAIVTQVTGNSVPGWSSLLCAVLLMGGLQLLAIGVIGEYIGRIYVEVKQRPRYIIEKSTLDE